MLVKILSTSTASVLGGGSCLRDKEVSGVGMRCLCLCRGWERGQGSLLERARVKAQPNPNNPHSLPHDQTMLCPSPTSCPGSRGMKSSVTKRVRSPRGHRLAMVRSPPRHQKRWTRQMRLQEMKPPWKLPQVGPRRKWLFLEISPLLGRKCSLHGLKHPGAP